MKGNIWNLIFSSNKKPKQKRTVTSPKKQRRRRLVVLPVYTTVAGEQEVALPSTTTPQTLSLAIEIATLSIDDKNNPPPTYSPYDLSPTSVRSAFQL